MVSLATQTLGTNRPLARATSLLKARAKSGKPAAANTDASSLIEGEAAAEATPATNSRVRAARSQHAQSAGKIASDLHSALPAAKGQVFGVAKGTGYYPANTRMEGGFVDKRDTKLNTLQDFLEGKAPYVSVAMDKNLYKNGTLKYGDKFRIPELEAKYGRPIEFRAVDTGGAFTNKGNSRIDICTRDKAASLDPTVNGKLTLIKVDDVAGAKVGDHQAQVSGAQALNKTYGPGAARAKNALRQEERLVRRAVGAAQNGASRQQISNMVGGDQSLAELIQMLLMAIESGDPSMLRAAAGQLSNRTASRARSKLGHNPQAQSAVDRVATPSGPIKPGQNGTAVFDTVKNAGSRRQMVGGRVTVNGNTYNFRSGGHGRGSLPAGDYNITKHMNSRGDRSMNVGGVGYSFAMSDKYDPRVGGTRSLLRIHPDGGSAGTMGCLGIVGDAATQAAFRRDMNAEIEKNGGSYTLRVGPASE